MAKKPRVILDDSDKQELQNGINQKAGIRELTRAEFDALSPEEKNASTFYIITDEDEDEGGGTDVEANPEGEAAEQLSTVKIAGKVYSTGNPYALAKANGYTGTEEEFGAKLADLLALEVWDGEYEVIE